MSEDLPLALSPKALIFLQALPASHSLVRFSKKAKFKRNAAISVDYYYTPNVDLPLRSTTRPTGDLSFP
jgi:hypothetical protein